MPKKKKLEVPILFHHKKMLMKILKMKMVNGLTDMMKNMMTGVSMNGATLLKKNILMYYVKLNLIMKNV
jgi:hypothetical protein